MDADELLARQLQEEERLAATQMLRGGNVGQAQFMSQVQGGIQKVQGYEDEMAQAMALSVLPLDHLSAAAAEAVALSAAMGEAPALEHDAALAQELLSWFKRDFFRWVNNPPCDTCGSGDTRPKGTVGPTTEEAADGAGRTEVYACAGCGSEVRFPRYNDPVKLLQTRRGRCGEWANCFTLCCRAAGLDARLVLDWTDHVWTELWTGGKWVHMDPCEAAYDKTLLYSAGWGKKLSYCIAVGRGGVVDVSRRYSKDWADLLTRRTQVTEGWLQGYLASVNQQLRAGLPAAERAALEERDRADRAAMERVAGPLTAAELALPGRESGSEAWRAARGELGSCGAEACAKPQDGAAGGQQQQQQQQQGEGTRYRLARDEGLLEAQRAWGARVCGGAVRASGENQPEETADKVCDGNPGTKWLDFGGRQYNAAWLEYRLPPGAGALALAAYALTSANDAPERDPAHWVLEALVEDEGADCVQEGTGGSSSSSNGGEQGRVQQAAQGAGGGKRAGGRWVVLDERSGVIFAGRHARLQFELVAGAAEVVARRWRLRVVRVADPAAANSVQLACWDLYRRTEQ